MKIIAHTPTELIVRDTGLGLRLFGVALLALAVFVVAIGLADRPDDTGIAAIPAAIAAVTGAGALALIILPARKTFAFSKAERVFIIASQRFGRVERQTYPLRDVVDVLVEESTSSDGDTYRVSITLADQRRIPWTSYYSSGVASKRATVNLVREFLELDANPQLGSGAVTATDERDARRGRAGLYFMGAFCCLFLGIGGTMLVKEHRRLTLFEPVQATVLSTRVEEHSDSDGSTYEPVVVYRYRVNDREYTASRVTPLKESRSGRWARRVTSRYQIGSDYTAYYDPENPSEAFLLRSRSIIPWAFLLIPTIGLLFIGIGIRGSYQNARESRWPRTSQA